MAGGSTEIVAVGNDREGVYLFCLARRDAVPPPADGDGTGLEDGHPVMHWPLKSIVAVLTNVLLDPWTGPRAETNLQDLSWVGPRACRHEEVIEQVMRHSPVFPAKFGTIFSSLESLGRLIEDHYNAISTFLDHTMDKREWAVKGLLNRAMAQEERFSRILAGQEKGLPSLSPGLRYFQEQQMRSVAKKELNSWLRDICRGVANDLDQCASDFCRRKPLSRDVTGSNMDMVLNWAYLVSRSAEPDFRAQIDRANTEHGPQGLVFQLSGPWPPYSFTPALAKEQET